MAEFGKRIYFELNTGNVIVDTGERQGAVSPTTIDQDIQSYLALSQRNRDTYDVIELEFGAYRQEFSEGKNYRVNPGNRQLEFSNPDTNQTEPVYQKPYEEQIKDLETKTDNAIMELTMLIALGSEA